MIKVFNEGIIKTNKNKLKKILDLFMNDSDKEALEELYKETNDYLVKILLDWKNEYYEELENVYTYQYSMYSDIIQYIFEKYKLNKI